MIIDTSELDITCRKKAHRRSKTKLDAPDEYEQAKTLKS